MFDFKQFLNDCIDEARQDIWAESEYRLPKVPNTRFDRAHARQEARAAIYQAIIDFRSEVIGFSELVESLQAFDPTVTPDDALVLVGRGVRH